MQPHLSLGQAVPTTLNPKSREPKGQFENGSGDAILLALYPFGSYIPLRSRYSLPLGTPAANCSARMAAMGSLASGADHHDHSTLEVVPTHDYDRIAFNKNDKIAFVPCHEHDKVFVPPQPNDAAHYHQGNFGPWSPQTTLTQSGSVWGGATATSGGDVGTEKREKILGLKRRIFFAVLGIIALLVAIGIGVGIGVGVSTRSTNNAEAEAAANASSTSDVISISTTSIQTLGTATGSVQSTTATSASRTSTSESSTSSAPQSTASRQVGGIGGRCSENWGSDCICLDEEICAGKWSGTAQTGRRPNWPCPNDPDNVKGCYVQPCKDASQPSSRCMWTEGCAELDPGKCRSCSSHGHPHS